MSGRRSAARRQAGKDAERSASADSVRAYLQPIGKIVLLTAAEEVHLAQRVEAYAAERVRRTNATEELSRQLRWDLWWIVRDDQRARTTCWMPTCGWSSRWPSASPAAVWHSGI